jgi:hypothetical protein
VDDDRGGDAHIVTGDGGSDVRAMTVTICKRAVLVPGSTVYFSSSSAAAAAATSIIHKIDPYPNFATRGAHRFTPVLDRDLTARRHFVVKLSVAGSHS